jgi:pimeloyl-ACP methyl ester carboxylesterase
MISTMKRIICGLLAVAVIGAAACSSDDDTQGASNTTVASTPLGKWSNLPGAQAATVNADGVAPLPPIADNIALPIVFVHGFAGSAQQYESQSMRFVANGYPQERIVVYEHDGAGLDIPGYVTGLDKVVDNTLTKFDATKVFLVGHSRGTTVSTEYLSNRARAAKIAKYVAIDGRPCPTGIVPCIAPTQENKPGQSHVEVATSKESFAMQYQFLLGKAPTVVDIVPQKDPIVISGRAVNFPANTGRQGTHLDIWAVDAATGKRTGHAPHAAFDLDGEGNFGPLVVQSGAHYEYVLSANDTPVQHHLYLQPYVRDSHLVRLLSSGPDGPTRTNTNIADEHAAIIAIRMREWYATDDGDLAGDDRDLLEISTQRSAGDVAVVNAIVGFVGNGAIGLHIHDDKATPGRTTRAPLPYFSSQPFQNGIDVFIPAAEPPDGTITVRNIPRGETSKPQVLNVPNWSSAGHAISVVFTDYPVD